MDPVKRVRVQKVSELSFQCEGTMHVTVKKLFDQYGGEQNFLAYTFKGENADLHGMLHNGTVSKNGETYFMFFTNPEMDITDSVEMAGTVAGTNLVDAKVDEAAGSLTEEENEFGGKHVM